ncbi:MAG: hypothetical protein KJO91_03770 [Gammaproteobacteria bacterium]|nr:hypothetical protein [Gammaproteobacteria bacterium]
MSLNGTQNMNIQIQNYQSKLSVFTFAALASFGAQSGTIDGTQFYTGAPLTADMMTGIAAAVNDNDLKASTNAANITINAENISSNTTRIETLEGEAARTTVTVNRQSASLAPGASACINAICPDTHPIAVGGGVIPQDVVLDGSYMAYMVVTASYPDIGGRLPTRNAVGEYPNASSVWNGCAKNEVGAPQSYTFNVVAICSDK